MRQVIITGDSHLGAMRRAVDAAEPGRFEGFEMRPLGRGGLATTDFFCIEDGGRTVRTTPEDWRNQSYSAEILGGGLLVVSMPLNTARILRSPTWKTHLPAHLCRSEDEVPLSLAVVDALIDQDSGQAVAFVLALKRAGIDVAAVEGPRFFENAPYLKAKRFEVCQFVDDRYRTRVAGLLEAGGVPVIRQPAGTITDHGTTKLAYDHEDPEDVHHANPAYGALVLEAIRDRAVARDEVAMAG